MPPRSSFRGGRGSRKLNLGLRGYELTYQDTRFLHGRCRKFMLISTNLTAGLHCLVFVRLFQKKKLPRDR
jgi:hypothetical protein